MRYARKDFIPVGLACLLGALGFFGCSGPEGKAAEPKAAETKVTEPKTTESLTPGERKGSSNSFRFVVYGDTRDGHAMHRKIVALIMKQKPDFVVQTGDLVHTGSNAALWKIYDEITGDMRQKLPVYPARGNHDVGGPGYEERVTTPFTSGNKLYYSFDKGASHFIALAVDEASRYDSKSPQYQWLANDLAAAKGKAKQLFVFFHVAPYSVGSHGSDEDVQKVLCPLFTKYGVRAVFNGHDHLYYHTVRAGITYVVAGGGGAPLYPVHEDQLIAGDKAESVNNIVVVDVKGDKIECEALRSDGSLIEHFLLP